MREGELTFWSFEASEALSKRLKGMHRSEAWGDCLLSVYPQTWNSILRWDVLYAEKTIAVFILMLQTVSDLSWKKKNEDSKHTENSDGHSSEYLGKGLVMLQLRVEYQTEGWKYLTEKCWTSIVNLNPSKLYTEPTMSTRRRLILQMLNV